MYQPEPISLQVGHLVALRTEKSEDAPWIARVTSQDDSNINIVWMEGSYNRRWKIAQVRSGRALVDWKDSVPKACIIMYGFELTNTQRLRKETVSELKELYKQYF